MNRESTEVGLITITPGASPRRNSTGKIVLSTPNSPSVGKEKVIPHYLRASTSSCHDFCKYGRKHSFDEKERRPIFLRKSESNAASKKGVTAPALVAKRVKKLAVRPTASSTIKPIPDEEIKEEVREVNAPALAKNDINESEGVNQIVPLAETETSEDSESVQIYNAPSLSGSESPSSIIHDVYVIEDELGSAIADATATDMQAPVPAMSIGEYDPSTEHEVVKSEYPVPNEATETGMQALVPEMSIKEFNPSPEHKVVKSEYPVLNEATETDKQVPVPEMSIGEYDPSPEHEVFKCEHPVLNEPTETNIQGLVPEMPLGECEPSMEDEVVKSEYPVLNVKKEKAPSNARAVKKDRIPMKKAPESVKPKAKPVTSSPVPSVPKHRVTKQTTQPVVKPTLSAKPTISSRPVKNVAKEATPAVKSKPTLKTTVKLNATSLKSLRSLPKASVKLSMRPMKKSKSPSSSPSETNATPLTKTKMKPPLPSSRVVGENVEKKVDKLPRLSKFEGKKVLPPPKVTTSSRISAKQSDRTKVDKPVIIRSLNSSKNLKKAGGVLTSNEKVREKTIYVVEPPKASNASSRRSGRSSTSRHSPSLSLASLSSFSSHVGGAKPKERLLKTPGRAIKEDKESAPYKLKFRRGRVVNIQQENNTAPTWLKFRPRRVVGSSPSGKWGAQKSLRRKSEAVASDEKNEDPEAGSIMLRHQSTFVAKKDSQPLLLNHMIEETASKLAETRKSKVKALVGAFETVISLQESKPV